MREVWKPCLHVCVCQCVIIHREELHPLSKHVPEHTHCPRSLCYHIISFEGVWNIVSACLLSCRETASSCSLAMEPISHSTPPVTPPTFCYHGGYHADTKGPILEVQSTLLGCFRVVQGINCLSLSISPHLDHIVIISVSTVSCAMLKGGVDLWPLARSGEVQWPVNLRVMDEWGVGNTQNGMTGKLNDSLSAWTFSQHQQESLSQSDLSKQTHT